MCPNGHRLHVKAFLAGKRGICPECGATFVIPPATGDDSVEAAESIVVSSPPAPPDDEAASPAASFPPAPPPPPTPPPPAVPPASVAPTSVEPPADAADADDDVAPPDPEEEADVERVAKGRALNYRLHRSRIRRTQMTLTFWLVAMVIALAALLIWVLWRGSGQPSAEAQQPLASLAESARSPYVAAEENASLWAATPRATTV